jgi:hypothetical protein
MVTRQISTSFLVEPTKYGWSVCAGTRRVGLFTTQRHAIEDVKRLRRALRARGKASTLMVRGSDPAPPCYDRGKRSFLFNR